LKPPERKTRGARKIRSAFQVLPDHHNAHIAFRRSLASRCSSEYGRTCEKLVARIDFCKGLAMRVWRAHLARTV
jgi:hypothetical protein